jgi:hypothetical protein
MQGIDLSDRPFPDPVTRANSTTIENEFGFHLRPWN